MSDVSEIDKEMKRYVDGLRGRMERLEKQIREAAVTDLFLFRSLLLDELAEFTQGVGVTKEFFGFGIGGDGAANADQLTEDLCRTVNAFVLSFFNPERIQNARQEAMRLLNDLNWVEKNICGANNLSSVLLEMRNKEAYEKTYHLLLVLLDKVSKLGPVDPEGGRFVVTSKTVRKNLIYLYPQTVNRVVHNIT